MCRRLPPVVKKIIVSRGDNVNKERTVDDLADFSHFAARTR